MQWWNCEDLIWAQKENWWTFYAWSNSENATILHKDKIGMIDWAIHMQKQKSVGIVRRPTSPKNRPQLFVLLKWQQLWCSKGVLVSQRHCKAWRERIRWRPEVVPKKRKKKNWCQIFPMYNRHGGSKETFCVRLWVITMWRWISLSRSSSESFAATSMVPCKTADARRCSACVPHECRGNRPAKMVAKCCFTNAGSGIDIACHSAAQNFQQYNFLRAELPINQTYILHKQKSPVWGCSHHPRFFYLEDPLLPKFQKQQIVTLLA